jgi:hypothetical protein
MTAPHMVALALRLERSLAWDRATQRFYEPTGQRRDDAQANRLLDRARREPWIL